jgi:hypothetical protein
MIVFKLEFKTHIKNKIKNLFLFFNNLISFQINFYILIRYLLIGGSNPSVNFTVKLILALASTENIELLQNFIA